jgi:adenylate kinase family enzyme
MPPHGRTAEVQGDRALVGSPVVRRISVVGVSGSGKSRLARELAGILDVPYIELDAIVHQADWVPLPAAELRARVEAATAAGGWVVDGNYGAVRMQVWDRADTVVWLDIPRRTVMRRIILRTIHRVVTRAELWNGNRERWRNFFSLNPERSVIAWSWASYADKRQRYRAAAVDPAYAHLTFIRIANRADARRLLADAARQGGPPG